MVELALLQEFVIVPLDSRDEVVKVEYVRTPVRTGESAYRRILVSAKLDSMGPVVNSANVLCLA